MRAGFQLFLKRKIYTISQNKTKLLKFSSTKFNFLVDGYILDKNGEKPNLKKIFLNINSYNEIKLFLKNYRGAFSLICISKNCQDIIIARDFDGSNPLYYKNLKTSLEVSNRPKQLFNSNKILNHDFCNKYIRCRYNFIYGSKETFIKKINFLEASTIIYFKNFKKYKKEIFDNRPLKTHTNNSSYNQFKSEIPQILKKSFFKNQNVYKGSIIGLSGGLDSTTVASVLGDNGLKLDAFTANYETLKNTKLNEASNASLVAKKYCKKWIKININSQEFFKYWANLYEIFDYPVCTSSFLGYLILYDKIKSLGYKKIVNAGNSDLFFHGNYPCYLFNLLDLYEDNKVDFNKEFNHWVKNHSTKEYPKNLKTFFEFKKNIKFFSKNGLKKIKPNYTLINSKYFKEKSKHLNKYTYKNYFYGKTYLDAYVKFAIWISDKQPNILPFYELEKYTNIISIDPFLKEELKNYFYNVPDKFKIQNGIGKKILRDSLNNILPKKIRSNFNKTGFNVPLINWIYEDRVLEEFVITLLLNFDKNCKHKIFKLNIKVDVQKLISDIKKKKLKDPNIGMIIWQITNLQLWYEKNF